MPFVLITLVGLLLLPVAPAWLLLPVVFVVLMNASGAAGDILVVGWLLLLPANTLIRDKGDAITLYRPQADAASARPTH
jgi:phytoene dehydrogenase-like protein